MLVLFSLGGLSVPLSVRFVYVRERGRIGNIGCWVSVRTEACLVLDASFAARLVIPPPLFLPEKFAFEYFVTESKGAKKEGVGARHQSRSNSPVTSTS